MLNGASCEAPLMLNSVFSATLQHELGGRRSVRLFVLICSLSPTERGLRAPDEFRTVTGPPRGYIRILRGPLLDSGLRGPLQRQSHGNSSQNGSQSSRSSLLRRVYFGPQ